MPPSIPRCLVVDDDAGIRMLITLQLEEVGGDVTVVPTCEEALEALQGGDFDLIVADRRLGGASGLTVLQAARQRPSARPPTLVLMSAQTDSGSSAEAESIDAVLVDKMALHEIVDRWRNILDGGGPRGQ